MAIFSGKIIEASYTNAKKDTVEIVYKEETKAIVYYIQTNHNHPHFQDLIKEYPLDKIQATTTAKIKQYNDNLKAANKADLDKFKQEEYTLICKERSAAFFRIGSEPKKNPTSDEDLINFNSLDEKLKEFKQNNNWDNYSGERLEV